MRFVSWVSVVCVVGFGSARAEAEPLGERASASSADGGDVDDARVAAALREQGGRARTHRYAWTAVNGALALGSFAVLPILDRESRPDFVVSGVGSVLGAALTFAFPMRVEADSAEPDAAERLPRPERHRKLGELLRTGSEDERARFAWPWHLANLGLSAVAGGVVAFGLHHTESGVLQGVGSFVLGEAQLFTQPTGLVGMTQGASTALSFRPQVSTQQRALSIAVVGSF